MSEYITHIAVLEDVRHLALNSKQFCDAFKLCFREHALAAQMGSASRGNNTFIAQNINHYRDIWESRKPADRLEDKLAYTLGWVTHRATDRYFKPKYSIFDKNPESLKPVDARIFHDVVTYRKVFANGAKPPFSKGFAEEHMKSHPASAALNISRADAIFSPMYQAELINLQSFDQATSAEDFMERLEDQFPDFTVDFDRLIEGVQDPDPTDFKRIIEDPNFYDEKDPLIQRARTLQEGGEVKDIPIEEQVENAGKSQYAEVLAKALRWVFEGNRYFAREVEGDKVYLYKQFDIYEGNYYDRY